MEGEKMKYFIVHTKCHNEESRRDLYHYLNDYDTTGQENHAFNITHNEAWKYHSLTGNIIKAI